MMITAPSRREDSTEAGKEIYKAKRLSDQNVGMGRDGGSIYKKDRGRGYEEDGTSLSAPSTEAMTRGKRGMKREGGESEKKHQSTMLIERGVGVGALRAQTLLDPNGGPVRGRRIARVKWGTVTGVHHRN